MAGESRSGAQSCRSDWGGCLGSSARTVPVGWSLRGENGLGWRRGRCLAGGLVVVRLVVSAAAVLVRADADAGFQVRLQLHFEFLFLCGALAVFGCI